MKRFKAFKKLFSLALILSMLLSMIPTSVFATTTQSPTIDGSKTGSLTINKYDGKVGETSKPLSGVTFTTYQIFNILTNKTSGTLEYTITSDFTEFFTDKGLKSTDVEKMDGTQLGDLAKELATYAKENNITGISKTTNESGQALFSNLDLGYYLIDETAYPDQVVTLSDPFLVSVPMTNAAGNAWDYDIVASPKNRTSSTEATLTKYGQAIGSTNKELLSRVAFKLQKLENNNDWVTVENAEELVTAANGQITVSGLTRGKYRFVEIEAPNGYIANTIKTHEFEVKWDTENEKLVYVYNGIESDSLNIEVINEKPTVDKTVNDPDVNIGDTVSWKITATVPSTIENLKTFIVTDTLSKGLTYNTDQSGLVVKQGDNELPKDAYELVNTNDSETGETKLVFTFVSKKLDASKDITIIYNTIVNENAVIGTKGNPNKVNLIYSTVTSTDIDTETGFDDKPTTTPEVEVKVYTFGLKVLKVNNASQKLKGALFNLYKGDGTTLIKEGLETDANGTITVPGLETGDYVLVETKAPTGYNLLKEPVKFTIKAEYGEDEDGKLIVKNTNTKNAYYELTVVNKKGFQLPATGGAETVIFTVAGLGIMGLAGAAYIALKRKESQQ